ncbi:MAG: universal stress protein [Saprospiraceae bacterium]|nr:universal stress protein [Saprospiraceae bacterium]
MARLIVPTDYSTTAEKALDQAFLLAKKDNDEVELLHVVVMSPTSDSPKIYDYIMSGKKEEEGRLKALAAERIKALGLPATTRWRVKVLYAEHFLVAITHRFEKSKAKLVVMGTTGISGLANKIFGSNTANLISKAELPVLTVPPSWKPTILQKLEFCLPPEEVPAHKKEINKWAKWMGATASIAYFTNIADAVPNQSKSPFPIKTIVTLPEEPLYEDLVEYSANLKATALCMFVHERLTVFERIFDRSVTGQVAGRVHIPMLALPIKAA